MIYIDIILELFGYAIVMSEMINDMWFNDQDSWKVGASSQKQQKEEGSFRYAFYVVSFSKAVDFRTYIFVLFESIYSPI